MYSVSNIIMYGRWVTKVSHNKQKIIFFLFISINILFNKYSNIYLINKITDENYL